MHVHIEKKKNIGTLCKGSPYVKLLFIVSAYSHEDCVLGIMLLALTA